MFRRSTHGDWLRDRYVEGNDFSAGTSFPKPPLGECPRNSPAFFETDTGMCELCDEDENRLISFCAILIGAPLALYVLYYFASSSWRPSNREGVDCVVLSGARTQGFAASNVWHDRLAAHLDIVQGEIKVDHAGAEIQPGDDVRIYGLGPEVKAHHRCRCPRCKTVASWSAVLFMVLVCIRAGGTPGLLMALGSLLVGICCCCKKHCCGSSQPNGLLTGMDRTQLNGHVGTVMSMDSNSTVSLGVAKVCIHGMPGTVDVPVDSLQIQPLFVEAPRDAPATCFCISHEWADSPGFLSEISHILAKRSGVDDELHGTLTRTSNVFSILQNRTGEMIQVNCPFGIAPGQFVAINAPDGTLLQVQVPAGVGPGMSFQVETPVTFVASEDSQGDDTDEELLRALTAGTLFVLCDQSAWPQGSQANDSVARLSEVLKLAPEQIVHADATGDVRDTRIANRALNDLEHFLVTHRHTDEHATKQGVLLDVVDNRAAVKGALSDQSAHHVAGHASSLIKILVTQLQQSFAFISWPWSWPKLLLALRKMLGSWVMVDLPALLSLDCWFGGTDDAVFYGGVLFPIVFLAGFVCVCCVSSRNRKKYRKTNDEAAGAKAAHYANFGWAMFTLLSPAVVAGIVAYERRMWVKRRRWGDPTPVSYYGFVGFLISSPFTVLVPVFALWTLHKAKASGVLQSRAFEARYGWLCSRCATQSIPKWTASMPACLPCLPMCPIVVHR